MSTRPAHAEAGEEVANQDSPSKRTRWDVQAPPAHGQTGASQAPLAGAPITLEQLTAQLAAALTPVTGGMQELTQRLVRMESEVTEKVGSALELIRTVDQRQRLWAASLKK